jgi:hypothetical protein
MNPFPAGLIDTRGNPLLRNVEVDCTHREFLFRRTVYRAILEELRGGGEGGGRRRLEVVG